MQARVRQPVQWCVVRQRVSRWHGAGLWPGPPLAGDGTQQCKCVSPCSILGSTDRGARVLEGLGPRCGEEPRAVSVDAGGVAAGQVIRALAKR